eukprot:350789_1
MNFFVLSTLFLVSVINGETWYPVKETHIVGKSEFGVESIYSAGNSGNLVIDATIKNSGCSAPESHIFAFISDAVDGNYLTHWSKIEYKMQFWGGSSCWSLFGNTHYGDFPDNLNAGIYEYDVNSLHDFGIISEDLTYGSWNGETIACDNEDSNFWHGKYGSGYKGSITVQQRRDKNAFFAGIGSGHSCSSVNTAKVRFSNIRVAYE